MHFFYKSPSRGGGKESKWSEFEKKSKQRYQNNGLSGGKLKPNGAREEEKVIEEYTPLAKIHSQLTQMKNSQKNWQILCIDSKKYAKIPENLAKWNA